MAWSYSGDPGTSDKDELRFMVADTDDTVPLLTDEEIGYLISRWMPRYGSMQMVASVAAASIGRKFAGVTSIQADGVSVNVSEISKAYADMAASLRQEAERADIGGELDMSDIMVGMRPDPGIIPLSFAKGMHDNIEAGQQDFGSNPYWSELINWSPGW